MATTFVIALAYVITIIMVLQCIACHRRNWRVWMRLMISANVLAVINIAVWLTCVYTW